MTMNNNTVSREVFESFSGLGLSSRGKTSCRLDNFRVLADGSLEKREGIRQIATLPDKIRGICSFSEGGEEVILAIAGNCLFRLLPDGTYRVSSCLGTDEGEIGFFVYGGKLYLLDGADLYRYEGEGEARKVQGYTPLYGKDWNPTNSLGNTIYEPINLLSSHIRLHFRLGGSIEYIHYGIVAEEIDWVMLDGELLEPSCYVLIREGEGISFLKTPEGKDLEICLTLSESYYRNRLLLSCVSAAVYEDFENSRVFWYGGEDKTRLFVTSRTTAESLERDREFFPDSCGLYFPKGQSLTFGNGEPITALTRVLNRMMVFFPSSLWATELMDEAPRHGVSVSRSGIYRWKIDPDLLDECTVKLLSEEVTPFLEDGFFTRAAVCHHRGRGELWFYDRGGKEKRILLYSLDRGMWYCYHGISADRLFTFADGVGFSDGERICLFDRSLCVDRFTDGEREIEAIYESGRVDFGGADADKRLESVLLIAEPLDGEITVSVEDGMSFAECTVSSGDGASFGVYECRLPSGRFRTAKVKLSVRGRGRERIYRAELLAQKGKK